MELKTFDTILTEICDSFDELISPKKIARTNTNIIYLILKATAKGFEVINNICVVLSNKFDPLNCSDKDLVSTAKLVGTQIRAGAVSGLSISVYNSKNLPLELPQGTYKYTFSEDVSFSFTLDTGVVIKAESSVSFTALSDKIGAYPVTQQSEIQATSDDADIPSEFIFSCADNQPLLGYPPESILEFRQRLNTDTERQDVVNELKEKLLALPYVYDCTLAFNQTESDMTVGNFTVKPYYLLIVISTAKYTNEIADIVAKSAIYPTVKVDGESHEVEHINDVFASGSYKVYLNDFVKKSFSINLNVLIDSTYNSSNNVRSKIESALMNVFNTNAYRATITAEDVFNEISKLELAGVKVLGVTFEVDSATLSYISFNKTEFPNLTNVGGI